MITNTMMTLICDDDCNWYVVPMSRRDEANKYFEDLYALYSEGDFDIDPPEMPDFIKEVELYRLVFDNPREIE